MERDYVNLTSRFYREKVLESVRGAWVALLVTFGQLDMRLAWVDLDIAFRLRRISWYPIYIGYETTSGGGFKSDFKIGFHIWYLHLDWFYQIGFLSGSDTDLIQATFRLDLSASLNPASYIERDAHCMWFPHAWSIPGGRRYEFRGHR